VQDIFDALADPVRRRILDHIATAPMRVIDLTRELSTEATISRPAVSRHLRVLDDAGLVCVEDRGRERLHRLRPAALDEVTKYVASLTSLDRPQSEVLPPISQHALDALATEVYRTRKDCAKGERSLRRSHGKEEAG